MDQQYEGLFDIGDGETGDDADAGRNDVHPFMQQYGWIYQITLVADHERIPLAGAFNLPTIQFLNDLAYLKAKHEHEREMMARARNKQTANY